MISAPRVLAMRAVLFCVGIHKVVSLGGLLLSVQSKVPGLENPKSVAWKHECSGTLLSPQRALTCASCLVYPDERLGLMTVDSEDVRLYSGNMNPDDANGDKSGQVVYVRSVQIHPEFFFNENINPNEFNYAVLGTKTPFNVGDSLKVLSLYSSDIDDVRKILMTNGTKCVSMTWNFYVDGDIVNEKPVEEEIPAELMDFTACTNLSNFFIHLAGHEVLGAFTCVKGLNEAPLCRVDTGSPIIYDGKLIAIVINDKLDCNKGEEYAVVSGISNAMAFLSDPNLYNVAIRTDSNIGLQTSIIETARSEQERFHSALVIPLVLSTLATQ